MLRFSFYVYVFLLIGGALPEVAKAQPLEQAAELLRSGQHEAAEAVIQSYTHDRTMRSAWVVLWAEAQMQQGKFAEAQRALEQTVELYGQSFEVRWMLHEVARQTGQDALAAETADDMRSLAIRRPAWAWEPQELVMLGRFALAEGLDPKNVLTRFYDKAIADDPDCRPAYWAKGELGIDKGDFQLAANAYRAGLERFADDADGHAGLARSLLSSDYEAAMASVEQALEHNPKHALSLLLLAEYQMDREDYDAAKASLERITAVDPDHPQAWAYRAAIAQLQADGAAEKQFRQRGLARWAANPAVDHHLGRKLSGRYLFREGAAAQRRALVMDASYLPAQLQLAQDLLRLGDNESGYLLAESVMQRDPYSTLAFNLLELRDNVAGYATLVAPGLVVRMDPTEAEVYGADVLSLLQDAQSRLIERYGAKPDKPTLIEIFADQRDFAIRTFGLPGGIGYLGVCFGDVITTNSPATGATGRSNWRAVMYHEYAHVITLSQTKNRMPRWLSEGISVYEERLADPAWGQGMTPVYRERILSEGGLTPLSEMSSSFMDPSGPGGIAFAYYQSNLAVAYLIETYGFESMRRLLDDLGAGVWINDGLQSHFADFRKLEAGFEAFAKQRAESFGAGLDWTTPAAPDALLPENNAYRMQREGREFLEAGQYQQAMEVFVQLVEACPGWVGDDSPHRLLIQALLALERPDEAYERLKTWTRMDAEALDGFQMLWEQARDRQDWPAAQAAVEGGMGIQPMLPLWHLARAQIAAAVGDPDQGAQAYRAVLTLGPDDPVGVRYELAKYLHEQRTADSLDEARAHLVDALANAPRFRDGHRLLLQVIAEQDALKTPVPDPPVDKETLE